jgi:hypothetical protein
LLRCKVSHDDRAVSLCTASALIISTLTVMNFLITRRCKNWRYLTSPFSSAWTSGIFSTIAVQYETPCCHHTPLYSSYHLCFIVGSVIVWFLAQRLAALTGGFCGFPQSLKERWDSTLIGHDRFLPHHPSLLAVVFPFEAL